MTTTCDERHPSPRIPLDPDERRRLLRFPFAVVGRCEGLAVAILSYHRSYRAAHEALHRRVDSGMTARGWCLGLLEEWTVGLGREVYSSDDERSRIATEQARYGRSA
jgi:hypothetical protein